MREPPHPCSQPNTGWVKPTAREPARETLSSLLPPPFPALKHAGQVPFFPRLDQQADEKEHPTPQRRVGVLPTVARRTFGLPGETKKAGQAQNSVVGCHGSPPPERRGTSTTFTGKSQQVYFFLSRLFRNVLFLTSLEVSLFALVLISELLPFWFAFLFCLFVFWFLFLVLSWSLALRSAKPCGARRAERLGRSGGQGQRRRRRCRSPPPDH